MKPWHVTRRDSDIEFVLAVAFDGILLWYPKFVIVFKSRKMTSAFDEKRSDPPLHDGRYKH